ncbi:MAG: 6-bladed beta-propeller [Candidatus Latescibacteria bacterium]|nr:6-bladed beta-propeller [Candidatus Latescibacterota bacterium]
MALLFLFCGSCEKSAVENQNNVLAIKTQAQGTHLSLTDAITLERPETGPFLGRVRTITVLDDYIIIVDESVRVFDKEGSYKWSIGSRGDGEGQYKIPGEPVVIPNTGQILIYDGGTGQTLRFSIKGEFLGQLKLPERRFINRMVVSEDHNLIHTYVDKNKNGMLCVTPLDTGEDIARFKVSEAKYSNLFFGLKRSQGLAYDETRKIIYFALPWEEKVMRIDLAAQEFLTPITINHPKFINLKLNEGDERKNIIELFQNKFSRLGGMYLLSSGDILLRYMFEDSSMSTALILLSDLDVEPSAQELKNKLRYNVFTSHGKSIYAYSSSADGEDTNGRIRVYRLTEPEEAPTG